jgi:hypothetical protein
MILLEKIGNMEIVIGTIIIIAVGFVKIDRCLEQMMFHVRMSIVCTKM